MIYIHFLKQINDVDDEMLVDLPIEYFVFFTLYFFSFCDANTSDQDVFSINGKTRKKKFQPTILTHLTKQKVFIKKETQRIVLCGFRILSKHCFLINNEDKQRHNVLDHIGCRRGRSWWKGDSQTDFLSLV